MSSHICMMYTGIAQGVVTSDNDAKHNVKNGGQWLKDRQTLKFWTVASCGQQVEHQPIKSMSKMINMSKAFVAKAIKHHGVMNNTLNPRNV